MTYHYLKNTQYTPDKNSINLSFCINEFGEIVIKHAIKPSALDVKRFGYDQNDLLWCYHVIKQKKLQTIPKHIKARFRKYFDTEIEWVLFFKDLNKSIGRFRNGGKHWTEALPLDIAEWLGTRLRQFQEEMDEHCVDNYRAANVRKSSQMRRYLKSQKDGCCGFFDTVVICPIDQNEYTIGFNYGH